MSIHMKRKALKVNKDITVHYEFPQFNTFEDVKKYCGGDNTAFMDELNRGYEALARLRKHTEQANLLMAILKHK